MNQTKDCETIRNILQEIAVFMSVFLSVMTYLVDYNSFA